MDDATKRLCIKEWSEEDRPREKMLSRGIRSLGDAEILAILIGSGTRNETAVEVAQRILYGCKNSLAELGRLSVKDLCKIKGIGEAKAISIISAFEIGRRRAAAEPTERAKITSSRDIAAIFEPMLCDLPHEEFWIAMLNRANRVIDKQRISQGGLGGTIADIRIIMKHALDNLAFSIIAIHNHPSGNPTPSEDDKRLTNKLKSAAQFFEIQLLDHIIVASNNYLSFKDEGLL